MKTKRVITGIILVTVMAIFGLSAPAYAQIPPLPHAFYGTLTIEGEPAPIDTQVEVRGTGVETGITGNPVVITEEGWYGTADPLGAKLVVQGGESLLDGTTLTFYVDGDSTGKTYAWKSGGVTRFDLNLGAGAAAGGDEGDDEGGGGGGGGGGGDEESATSEPTVDLSANLFGNEFTYSISDTGEILDAITACSPDGRVCITIPAGTIALDKYQNPITSLIIEGNPSPVCPLAEGAHIIGLAYDFKPDRATFATPITLVFTYDEAEVPEGIAEEDLVLAYCDEVSMEWVEVDSVVNPVDNTITANIYHFTTFAILYYEVAAAPSAPAPTPTTAGPAAFTISSLSISPVEVNVGEIVTISLTVTNGGGESGTYQVTLKINGEIEDTKEVSIAAGGSQEVKLTTSKNVAGTYTVDCNGLVGSFVVKEVVAAPPAEEGPAAAPESQTNWPVLGGFIAAVVVVISLVIFFVVRKKSAY
jgi:hypothetical protein